MLRKLFEPNSERLCVVYKIFAEQPWNIKPRRNLIPLVPSRFDIVNSLCEIPDALTLLGRRPWDGKPLDDADLPRTE